MDIEDRLLDSALRTYAGEPRPGLEGRIMAGMRPRPSLWRWAWAVPVLAGLLMVIVYRQPAVEPPPRPVVAHAQAPPALPEPVAKVAVVARRRSVLPKRPEFFGSGPLSSEERALVAFVRKAPEQTLPPLGGPVQPIQIEEIRIEPLKVNGTE